VRVVVGALGFTVALLCFAAPLCAAGPSDRLPDAFRVHQNEVNPFCADSLGEWTEIRFELPSAAYIRLVVADPDTIIVMRTLIIGKVAAGYHVFSWDGQDDWGGYLAAGRYPYSLQVKDPGTGRWRRMSQRVATVDCTTDAHPATWGWIKGLYRPLDRPTPN